MLIPSNIFPIAKLACKEQTRGAIDCVRAVTRSGWSAFSATDGRRLLEVQEKSDPGELDMQALIAPKEMAKAKKMTGATKNGVILNCREMSNGTGESVPLGKDQESQWPNMNDQWGAAAERGLNDGFVDTFVNPAMLGEMLTTIGKMGCKSIRIRLAKCQFFNTTTCRSGCPIVITGKDESNREIRALQMPLNPQGLNSDYDVNLHNE